MLRTKPLLLHLRSRGRVRGFVACVSLASVLASTPPPEPTVFGVAALLGARIGGSVDAGSVAWEPRRNVLAELVFGRRLLFLAAMNGGPRDVFRASVRLTPSGQPLAVRHVENLTDTPDADELGLSLDAGVATFATAALGNVSAVTALALDGSELERTDVLIEAPAREATLARDARSLMVRLDSRDELRYDFARGALEGEPVAARVVRRPRAQKGFALAVSDALRRSLGERVTGALASSARAVRDWLERAAYALTHVGRRPEPRAIALKAAVKDVRDARRPEDVWPPPKVPSPFVVPEPEEGMFRALVTRGAEPCLYRTSTRADPLRPTSRAVVIAMDMRQLELTWIAGVDVPQPSAGPPGDGRLSRDPRSLARVVAVVSGGRSPTSARHGASSGGRVLAPPAPAAVSIVELARGETLLGPWPFGDDVPSDVVAFRQGLVPLLDARREPLVESTARERDVKPRSGLCATPAGHLYYAFGARLDALALASTLSRAGCAYAVELAGGAEPAGMALVNAAGGAAGRFTSVDPAMSFDGESVLEGASRDFFVLSLKDTTPREPREAVWKADTGTQPLPASITGIFRTSVPLGGLTVELFSFENGRVEWRLRPGKREPGARGEAWAGFLPEGDAERALAALELGHTTVTPRLGLALGTTTPITLKDVFATLVVAPTEPPRIVAPGEVTKLGADEQAVQLPLLADADGVTERARERGDLRMRSALGVTKGGRTFVALLRHDSSDPLAVALKNAGAERVVELDRGSHHPAFVHRAGTATPPTPTYESTTLWALGRPMLPGARIAGEALARP